jgi:hypothetical protein
VQRGQLTSPTSWPSMLTLRCRSSPLALTLLVSIWCVPATHFADWDWVAALPSVLYLHHCRQHDPEEVSCTVHVYQQVGCSSCWFSDCRCARCSGHVSRSTHIAQQHVHAAGSQTQRSFWTANAGMLWLVRPAPSDTVPQVGMMAKCCCATAMGQQPQQQAGTQRRVVCSRPAQIRQQQHSSLAHPVEQKARLRQAAPRLRSSVLRLTQCRLLGRWRPGPSSSTSAHQHHTCNVHRLSWFWMRSRGGAFHDDAIPCAGSAGSARRRSTPSHQRRWVLSICLLIDVRSTHVRIDLPMLHQQMRGWIDSVQTRALHLSSETTVRHPAAASHPLPLLTTS